jgi:predicted small secreted protein
MHNSKKIAWMLAAFTTVLLAGCNTQRGQSRINFGEDNTGVSTGYIFWTPFTGDNVNTTDRPFDLSSVPGPEIQVHSTDHVIRPVGF